MNASEWNAHLRYSLNVFLRRLAPGRDAAVYPDDVFLVSYPKSGNTWMRFLVGNLVFPNDPITFANVERRVPSIYGMSGRKLRLVPRPRYIKSHEPFHSKYQNVIYVVRDPRDVAVSYYHFALKVKGIPSDTTIDSFVSKFLADELWLQYGTWADHVVSWLAMGASRRGFLFLKYENLLSDTVHELLRIASFLKVEATKERLGEIVEMSSAKRMRDLEKKEWRKWSRGIRRSRRDISFVRAAKSKQWLDTLSADLIASIENAWGPLMEALGYKLVTDPQRLDKRSEEWGYCKAQVEALWPPEAARESVILGEASDASRVEK